MDRPEKTKVTIFIEEISPGHSIVTETDSGDPYIDHAIVWHSTMMDMIHRKVFSMGTITCFMELWIEAHNSLSKEKQEIAYLYYAHFWDGEISKAVNDNEPITKTIQSVFEEDRKYDNQFSRNQAHQNNHY